MLNENGEMTFFRSPSKRVLNYQQSADKYMNRIDVVDLKEKLEQALNGEPAFCLLERPFVNPMMFSTSLISVRALEATLTVLELLKVGYSYCDSKEWQRRYLPAITKTVLPALPKTATDQEKAIRKKEQQKLNKEQTAKLKEAAYQKAVQMFPNVAIVEKKDADSVFIALYAKQVYGFEHD